MKIILIQTVDSLGVVGDVVKVRPGYARNFLLPNKKALLASERNLKVAAHQRLLLEHNLKKARAAADEVRVTLEKKGVKLLRKAGEHGKLFGSVTTQDISDALRAQGAAVHRKFIHLEEPIKKTGTYVVAVRLDGGLEAKLNVEVAAATDAV